MGWRYLAYLLVLAAVAAVGGGTSLGAEGQPKKEPPPRVIRADGGLTPPASPLVACDPYFSIWSMTDQLTDGPTRHWTGKIHPLTCLVRIDGKTYRMMGDQPSDVPALEQTRLEVLPTRTIYGFRGAGIAVELVFLTATLPESLDFVSRPVTYLIWNITSSDGKPHRVRLYFDAGAEIAVDQPQQQVEWATEKAHGLSIARVGSREQAILGKRGDDLRIDWGYFYLAAPQSQASVADRAVCRSEFAVGEKLPELDQRMPRAADDAGPALAMMLAEGRAAADGKPLIRWLMLAYDDLYSIQYFGENLRPYWRRKGASADDLLKISAEDLDYLKRRCPEFDAELMGDLTRFGGERYARLAALAYRQCFAAHKLAADAYGQPLFFSKENFSNGCIGTVDVIYPASPLILLTSPSLTKAMLVPVLDYASSPRWRFPFAPHDLGQYPWANGQRYGGGERSEENQMPVEETGNMLIMLAALAQLEGNSDFAGRYWPLVARWAAYLEEKGFDPENQLCTDDFAGHLARNVNLSAKAIIALGAYGKLCRMRGDLRSAEHYDRLSRQMAARWMKEADDGDHFRLAFDKPGTWSQKYNLVWDRLLGLNLFPAEVAQREMAFYRKVQNRFGLPLDNRTSYTKLDWILWTATLTGKREDFEALADPVYDMLNHTPDRVPMTDWYWTENARKRGFQARSVVGGVFLGLLYDAATWRKWARRDQSRLQPWAPSPANAQAVQPSN